MTKRHKVTVLLTGAGSGGHITPVLAVASELKRLDPSLRTLYVGQRGDNLGDIPAAHEAIDEVRVVSCGKLRRYHGHGIRQLLDYETVLLNIRDVFRTVVGVFQSIWLVWCTKPAVAFIKGGFVGVPVGVACAILRVPYITHDSDALPGLANRLIAPWASLHTVALPKAVYSYPGEKTVVVGVPISKSYGLVDDGAKELARQDLGLGHADPVLFVSGGGLGAQRLNTAVLEVAKELFALFPKLWILHQGGRAHVETLSKAYRSRLTDDQVKRVRVVGFVTDLYKYSASADLVITRAGGTTLAELAVQAKACIVVPNPDLTGGHQLKNAKVLQASRAVEVVTEDEIKASREVLAATISGLLKDPQRLNSLSENLRQISQPDAAYRLAKIILEMIKTNSGY